MKEVIGIRTKRNFTGAVLFAVAAYIAVTAVFHPERTAESVSAAMELSVCAVVPSLFAFAAANKTLSPALAGIFKKARRLQRFFGVGAGGLVMIVSGMISGFPMAAVTYSELSARGAIDEREGESLMPFCTGASGAFLIGAVGEKMFGDVTFGVRLFICQSAAALLLILATRKKRNAEEIDVTGEKPTLSSAARAVAEAGAAMIGVTSFIVVFSVISDALAADLRLGVYADAVIRSSLEISGGLAALSRLGGAGRFLAGFAVGFSGISVLMQSGFASRGAAMKKYVSGKLIMSAVTGSLFSLTELFRAAPAFFELFGSRAAQTKNTAEFIAALAFFSAICTAIGAFARHKLRKRENKLKKFKKIWKNDGK